MRPLLKWLYPGLRVKRWFFLALVGVVFFSYGMGMLIPVAIPTYSLPLGLVFLGFGLVATVVGLRLGVRSLIGVFLPAEEERLVDVLMHRRQLSKGPKIVAIGGGTGLGVLLRGLKEYTGNITAIVTVTDTGGSSGRLRQELGILPPGDIRNCLVALADTEPLMESLFQYRFHEGEGLAGHNLGNLFLAGLTEILGDFAGAVKEVSRVLAVRGRVLPSTLEDVTLRAELASGELVDGETRITSSGQPILHLHLKPANPSPMPEAIAAILEADAVVLGPGSLYTSILPNLLVDQVVTAIRRSKGICIYVCNVMTQPGETEGFSAGDHLEAINQHVGTDVVDYVLVNTGTASPHLLERYRREGAFPVVVDRERLRGLGVKVVQAKLISRTDFVRHEPRPLARVIMKLVLGRYLAGLKGWRL